MVLRLSIRLQCELSQVQIPALANIFMFANCFVIVVLLHFFVQTHICNEIKNFTIPFDTLIDVVYLTYCKICNQLKGYQDTDLASLIDFFLNSFPGNVGRGDTMWWRQWECSLVQHDGRDGVWWSYACIWGGMASPYLPDWLYAQHTPRHQADWFLAPLQEKTTLGKLTKSSWTSQPFTA